jgi:hypothetical protein
VRRMKLCRYILAITVTLTLVVLGSSTVCAQDTTGNTTKAPTYDPLGVLAQFLDVVYPDLGAGHQGLATLKVSFDGVFVLGGVELEFHPCRISGVSTEPSPVPYCGDHSHDAKPFFNANIDFGRDKRTPILSFVASGTFIDDIRIQKIQEMRQRLPRNWTHEEALELLQSANPQYGPEHKKEFAASVPIEGIQEVTGCRLRPESAEFGINLSQIPRLQFDWTVRGVAPAIDSPKEVNCWASFEPFDGHLIAMGGFTQ